MARLPNDQLDDANTQKTPDYSVGSFRTDAILTDMTNTLTISHTTRSYPKLPYHEIKQAVLGSRYHVSLTFVGADRARQLNEQTRNKTYVPNVLSFPLDDTHGEIYIAPVVAEKEAVAFGMTARGYVGYLFIHGLLHLKGYDHGATMEKLEKRYCTTFKLK